MADCFSLRHILTSLNPDFSIIYSEGGIKCQESKIL
jgi:hypothetical protein